MLKDLLQLIESKERNEELLIEARADMVLLENEVGSELSKLGVNEGKDILSEIIAKMKTITDALKLNRIYSFLFKDELSASVKAVLQDKGILGVNDIELITSWIVTADTTLQEKRDFITQISVKADKPIVKLNTAKDFKKFSGAILPLGALVVNDHPVLDHILHKAIDWAPGGSAGGSAASAGPGEGMMKLLSYNALPITKGDVRLGNNIIEVKGNVKGNDGGALAGGKGASGWKSIDASSVLEKAFGVTLGNVDLRLINKTFAGDWVQTLETITRVNGGDNDTNFRKAILALSKAYFSNSGSKKSFKNFTKNLEKISFDKFANSKQERDSFNEVFCLYNIDYYREMENFDYLFLVQYTEKKFAFITTSDDFWKISNGLRIKPGDFKWDAAPGAFRLGLH